MQQPRSNLPTTSRIVLISPYEIGRQPFGLAQPTAWLREAGHRVSCLDLSLQRLGTEPLADAKLICVYVAMHTATRIAIAALPRIREAAPHAELCVFGLYAPMNASLFHSLGVNTVLGGESEPELLALAERVASGQPSGDRQLSVSHAKIAFRVPDRSSLPPLTAYAHLLTADGESRTVGFAEASRGCKHLCRHCPVVPVYEGRFRVVPADVVISDIRNQVEMGAQHISFGDPDFFNGPTHARKIVSALHAEFPHLSYDVTIKVEHLIKHRALLATLAATGCLFVTSAVESVDQEVLERLAKGHNAADFPHAVGLLREAGIALAPTFVPFTPWTTLDGYLELLRTLVTLELVEAVPPIQLIIRLLVPEGSYLLRLPGFNALIEAFDAGTLGYPWKHRDPRVDALQSTLREVVEGGQTSEMDRREIFARIWSAAHAALGQSAPTLPADLGMPVPHLSEPWYCCAEPTDEQLQAF